MAAQFVVDEFDVISDLMRRGQQQAVVDMVKGAPWRKRDAAADLGTSVHHAVEAYCAGDRLMGDVPPHIEHFEEFLNAFKPSVIESECTIFSDRWDYAGTLDLLVAIGDQTWLVDVKTGSGVYPEMALQIAAYAHGDFIGRTDGTSAPMPEVHRGAVLHLRPGGYKFVPVRIDDDVFRSYCYVREVFRWQEEISKTALHPVARNLDAITQRLDPADSAEPTGASNGEKDTRSESAN